MNNKQKKIILGLQVGLFLLAVFFGFRVIFDPNYNKVGGVLAGLVLPFLPQIIKKVFKIEVRYLLQLTYLVFLLAALFFGINMDFYKTIPFFDKVVHFFSGGLSIIVGLFALRYYKLQKTPMLFRAVFIISTCVSIGVLWEFFEFFCDKVLGQSMQQLISVGVDDTMWDLFSATLGASAGVIVMALGERSAVKNKKIVK